MIEQIRGADTPRRCAAPWKSSIFYKKKFCKNNLHFLLENSEVGRFFQLNFSRPSPVPHPQPGWVTPPAPGPAASPAAPFGHTKFPWRAAGKAFPGEIQRTPLDFSAPKPSLSSHTEMKEFLATLHIKLEQVLSIKKILNLARIYFSSSLSGH